MKISMYTMAVDSFKPMLQSLAEILDKGAAHAKEKPFDLMNARLAPDMFTLARQVQMACDYADGSVARLIGAEPPHHDDDEKTVDDLKARIARASAYVENADPAAFADAEERQCDFPMPNTDKVIAMNGLQFLRAWALPHFYFHVVTAYGILRHNGVNIGKPDYLSQVSVFIRPVA
jgi:uncharacterized protein